MSQMEIESETRPVTPVSEDEELQPTANEPEGLSLNPFPLDDQRIFQALRDLGTRNPASTAIKVTLEGNVFKMSAIEQQNRMNSTFVVSFEGKDGYPRITSMADPMKGSGGNAANRITGQQKAKTFNNLGTLGTGVGHYIIQDFQYKFCSKESSQDIYVPTDQFDDKEYDLQQTAVVEEKNPKLKVYIRLRFSILEKAMTVSFYLPPEIRPAEVICFEPASGMSGVIKISFPKKKVEAVTQSIPS